MAERLQHFEAYSHYVETSDSAKLAAFRTVYEHLLVLIDDTYEPVVKMRYDMLWNLLSVVNSKEKNVCRRRPLLQHFVADADKTRYEEYQCGLCDVCVG